MRLWYQKIIPIIDTSIEPCEIPIEGKASWQILAFLLFFGSTLSISSGQWNLLKTMKLMLAESQNIFDKVDWQKSDFQRHFSMSIIVRIFIFFFIEEYWYRKPTFIKKNIFDQFTFENYLS